MIELMTWAAFGAIADRYRGDPKGFPRIVEKLLVGLFVGLAMGVDGLLLIGVCVCVAIGASPGWGAFYGSAVYKGLKPTYYEVWQIGPFRNHWLAMILRGFMWGLPAVLLTPWLDPMPILIAYTVAFPLAALIARWCGVFTRKTWELSEYLRGGMVVLIAGLLA